jgi:hypothetical protein
MLNATSNPQRGVPPRFSCPRMITQFRSCAPHEKVANQTQLRSYFSRNEFPVFAEFFMKSERCGHVYRGARINHSITQCLNISLPHGAGTRIWSRFRPWPPSNDSGPLDLLLGRFDDWPSGGEHLNMPESWTQTMNSISVLGGWSVNQLANCYLNVLIIRSKPPIRGCNQKFPDWVDNEIYVYKNKFSLRSNTKGYGGKTN